MAFQVADECEIAPVALVPFVKSFIKARVERELEQAATQRMDFRRWKETPHYRQHVGGAYALRWIGSQQMGFGRDVNDTKVERRAACHTSGGPRRELLPFRPVWLVGAGRRRMQTGERAEDRGMTMPTAAGPSA